MRDSGTSRIPDDSNGRRKRGGVLATNRPRGFTTTKKLVSQFLISKHPLGGCTRPTERPTRVHSKSWRIRGPGYLFDIAAHPMGFLSFTMHSSAAIWCMTLSFGTHFTQPTHQLILFKKKPWYKGAQYILIYCLNILLLYTPKTRFAHHTIKRE